MDFSFSFLFCLIILHFMRHEYAHRIVETFKYWNHFAWDEMFRRYIYFNLMWLKYVKQETWDKPTKTFNLPFNLFDERRMMLKITHKSLCILRSNLAINVNARTHFPIGTISFLLWKLREFIEIVRIQQQYVRSFGGEVEIDTRKNYWLQKKRRGNKWCHGCESR